MRKTPFVNGEFYHIYNRGVEKRRTFESVEDFDRFLQCIEEFNTEKPIGSLYCNSFKKASKLSGPTPKSDKLIDIVCYCINPNHYHLVVEQKKDGGVSEFMKRLSGGYTSHFNNKYRRSGALFQGRFKSVHIDSNEYLLHLSAYVNLNNKVHQLSGPTAKLVKSSWSEYMWAGDSSRLQVGVCEKDIILGQFNGVADYKKFAESSLEDILIRKDQEQEIKNLLIE